MKLGDLLVHFWDSKMADRLIPMIKGSLGIALDMRTLREACLVALPLIALTKFCAHPQGTCRYRCEKLSWNPQVA